MEETQTSAPCLASMTYTMKAISQTHGENKRAKGPIPIEKALGWSAFSGFKFQIQAPHLTLKSSALLTQQAHMRN